MAKGHLLDGTLKAEDRLTYILDMAKAHPDGITRADITSAGIGSVSTIKKDLAMLCKLYPDNFKCRVGKKGAAGKLGKNLYKYISTEETVDTTIKETEKNMTVRGDYKYDHKHIENGKSDPTAASAFVNTTGTTYELLPGDVWDYTLSSGLEKEYLIIATNEKTATVISAYEANSPLLNLNSRAVVPINLGDRQLFADVSTIQFKPNKYARRVRGTVKDTDMDAVHAVLARQLHIKSTTNVRYVEVEKKLADDEMIIKKEDYDLLVNHPVAIEGPVDLYDTSEMLLLKQEAKIWKEAFYAVTCGVNQASSD